MLREDVIAAIEQSEFDEYREIDSSDIIFAEALLKQCSSNTCGNYGKNYTCPPHSGSIEENIARITKYPRAVLMNKIIEYTFRKEDMEKTHGIIKSSIKKLRELTKELPVMILQGGGCDICEKCAIQDEEPCRFPDKKRYSVEGSGINISLMAKRNGLTYNAGKGRYGFFFIILY